MILQYEMNGKEIYRESPMIGFAEIIAVGRRFEDVYSVYDFSEEQIKYRPESIEVCSLELEDNEKISKMQSVKMAILSNGADKKKNNTLLFSPEQTIYLLNENGKTLKRF